MTLAIFPVIEDVVRLRLYRRTRAAALGDVTNRADDECLSTLEHAAGQTAWR